MRKLMTRDTNVPPAEVKAKIESIARISAEGDGPPPTKPMSEVIPPHHPQGTDSPTAVPSSKSTGEESLISFDDDSDEFVDAHE
jgi:hypothetical protein